MDLESVVEEAKALGPWHFNIEIAPGLWTADCNGQGVDVVDPQDMKALFGKYYPNGLSGKDVLDAACNSGVYCFLAHELGARTVKGLEIRDHWLEQAKFVKRIKYNRVINISFLRRDARVYFETTRKRYDIVLLNGILDHFPDPIHALMGYCNLARETIVVDALCSYDVPEHGFASQIESQIQALSGIAGLAWRPGGPRAIQQILRYKGFERTDIQWWHSVAGAAGEGRMRVVGCR
jgi:SAM-dependent methyltransferase